MSLFRCYTEKKPGFDIEADRLRGELEDVLGLKIDYVRLFNRYDIEDRSRTYDEAKRSILSEPRPILLRRAPSGDRRVYFTVAVEALPGQYDQQPIQRPVHTDYDARRASGGEAARIYVFGGSFSATRRADRKYLINPVDSRKLPCQPDTLAMVLEAPKQVDIIARFIGLDSAAHFRQTALWPCHGCGGPALSAAVFHIREQGPDSN